MLAACSAGLAFVAHTLLRWGWPLPACSCRAHTPTHTLSAPSPFSLALRTLKNRTGVSFAALHLCQLECACLGPARRRSPRRVFTALQVPPQPRALRRGCANGAAAGDHGGVRCEVFVGRERRDPRGPAGLPRRWSALLGAAGARLRAALAAIEAALGALARGCAHGAARCAALLSTDGHPVPGLGGWQALLPFPGRREHRVGCGAANRGAAARDADRARRGPRQPTARGRARRARNRRGAAARWRALQGVTPGGGSKCSGARKQTRTRTRRWARRRSAAARRGARAAPHRAAASPPPCACRRRRARVNPYDAEGAAPRAAPCVGHRDCSMSRSRGRPGAACSRRRTPTTKRGVLAVAQPAAAWRRGRRPADDRDGRRRQ